MANTKISSAPVNPQADAPMLAAPKFHHSHVPEREPLALLKRDCVVPLPARDSGLIGCTIVGQVAAQQSASSGVPTPFGSLASQPPIPWESLRLADTASHIYAEERHAIEMAIACEVQKQLLPQRMPPLETLDYAATCEQAWTIGGDYYDFLDMGRGKVGFVLADVSGNGVFAALLMANLQASIRSQYVVALEDLEGLFCSVNKLFCKSVMSGFFASLFFAQYCDTTKRLRYVNCGHNPAFLVRANATCEKLGSTATVLGMFEKWNCRVDEATMSLGDILVVYSDGVTEAQNESGEFFGEEYLLAAVQANSNLSAAGLLKALAASVRNFGGKEQGDDLTLLVARAR
jgi:serine phosphatase RsbU (regulator of sigma subunit)